MITFHKINWTPIRKGVWVNNTGTMSIVKRRNRFYMIMGEREMQKSYGSLTSAIRSLRIAS